jgi:hypothetical protein
MRQLTRPESIAWRLDTNVHHRRSQLLVFLLDRPPDRRQLREGLGRAARSWEPLRSTLHTSACGLLPAAFVPTSAFSPEDHMRDLEAPADGRYTSLLHQLGPILSEPFDGEGPLWNARVVEEFDDGEAAIILHLHPLVAGNLRWLDALLDSERAPVRAPLLLAEEEPLPSWAAQLGCGLRTEATRFAARAGQRLAALPAALREPARSLDEFTQEIRGTISKLRPRHDGNHTRPEEPPHLASFTLPWDDLMESARVADCEALDILRAAIGLGLLARGDTQVIASLNDAESPWMSIPLKLPLDAAGGRALLEKLRVRRQHAERSAGRALMPEVAEILDRFPLPILESALAGRISGRDLRCEQPAGLPVGAFLAGARIDALRTFTAPQGHRIAASLVRSLDHAAVGLSLDARAFPNPTETITAIRKRFGGLLAIAG